MKLSVLQENLKTAVSLTSHFIASKAQLPILANILLHADKTKLILSATNLETSISISIGVKVDEVGEITVSGKTLNDVINNLSSGNIDLEVTKEQIKISSVNFKSKILGSNSADFPKLSKGVGKNSIIINKEEFTRALSKTLFAVSLDETRPILTGILFIFKNNNLFLVATDGFRLSQIKLKTEVKSENLSLIIPRAVLNEIIRIEGEENIEISFDKENNQVVFGIRDIIISSRVIEGEFPDYEKIIPTSSISNIFVDKDEFEKAIKLASVFARDSGNIVKLLINSQKLVVKAESSTSGNQETEIEIRSDPTSPEASRGETEILFNYKFIEDILKVIENDELEIQITGLNTACKFLDPKSKNFLHIIMPIKTQS